MLNLHFFANFGSQQTQENGFQKMRRQFTCPLNLYTKMTSKNNILVYSTFVSCTYLFMRENLYFVGSICALQIFIKILESNGNARSHKIVDIFKQFTEREGDIIKKYYNPPNPHCRIFFKKCMKSLESWNIFVEFDHSNIVVYEN